MAAGQLVGDANCDGAVNTDDLTALIATVFDGAQSDCPTADVNADGVVDGADIVAWMQILGAPPAAGPIVTFLGLAGSDGTAVSSLGQINGAPVYFRTAGFGFSIVVEGATGPSGLPPGTVTFNTAPNNPARRPDLQIESSNPLGDGSTAVCDGGVPAVAPPDFGPSQTVANTLNDFACNFAAATSPNSACTLNAFGATSFLGTGTQVQFCGLVTRTRSFPTNQTVLSVRLRDTGGNLGSLRQLIVRVGSGPMPPTFTPNPSPVPTTPRSSATPTPTATPARTPTPSKPPSATASPTPTFTRVSATSTPTATLRASPTKSAPGTASGTAIRTPTPTHSATQSPTPTPTPSIGSGPIITFFGLTLSDDTLMPSTGTTPDGWPIYARQTGTSFSIVVEGKPGPSGASVGPAAYAAAQCPTPAAAFAVRDDQSAAQSTLTAFPDLQIEVSQPLGNGSSAVCDNSPPTEGGVPAINPPSFAPTQTDINTINDLGCRFVNGSGMPCARGTTESCVLLPTGNFSFVDPSSSVQFCGLMSSILQFPAGDTVVTARLRDLHGNTGPAAQLVVRILTPTLTPTSPSTSTATPRPPGLTPTATPTSSRTGTQTPGAGLTPGAPTKTATRTPTATPLATRTRTPAPTATPTAALIGPVITFFGLTRADDTLVDSSGTTTSGIPIFSRPVGSGFSIVIEGMPGPQSFCTGGICGTVTYEPDLSSFPDLLVEVSQPLGNGSAAVCDATGATAGGVPAINPPSFDPTQTNIAAVNDLGCRFENGSGMPVARTASSDSCIMFPSGDFRFMSSNTTMQFCGVIGKVLEFQSGDTVITARLRDLNGNLGPSSQIVVRIGQ